MKGLSQNCYNLAHTNSKVFFFVGGWHLHPPDTQLHTNTVSGHGVFLVAIYSVMGTETRHSQKSPLAHLQDLARSTESFSLVDHCWSPNCCTFRTHTIVNNRLKYRIV